MEKNHDDINTSIEKIQKQEESLNQNLKQLKTQQANIQSHRILKKSEKLFSEKEIQSHKNIGSPEIDSHRINNNNNINRINRFNGFSQTQGEFKDKNQELKLNLLNMSNDSLKGWDASNNNDYSPIFTQSNRFG